MHDHSPDTRPQTLHARIRAEIEARILSGEWPPGYRIPPETELVATYSCSRMTVNKAMSSLAAEGLILRNRRAGTVVARPRIHSAILNIPDIRAKVEERGAIYGYHALTDELRPPCCVHLGAQGHHLGRSRFIRSLHSSDGLPVMLEDRHIFLDTAPEAEHADFRTQPPGTWLVAHVPWTEAEHRIAAISADTASARALQITSTSPCLLVERRTWRGTDTVTIVRQVFRGDAFDLVARFGPGTDRA
ncbi:MAG: histidine utilization repressor [Rhodobacterales bacterium 17-64-5]|nr:MAG: histidine utilization repressor [Rhodobacterales bacterium 17-64-5]